MINAIRRRLRVLWWLPTPKGLGKLLVQVLPMVDRVEYADAEGAIFLTLPITDDQVEWIQELARDLKIEVHFEDTGE